MCSSVRLSPLIERSALRSNAENLAGSCVPQPRLRPGILPRKHVASLPDTAQGPPRSRQHCPVSAVVISAASSNKESSRDCECIHQGQIQSSVRGCEPPRASAIKNTWRVEECMADRRRSRALLDARAALSKVGDSGRRRVLNEIPLLVAQQTGRRNQCRSRVLRTCSASRMN